MDPSAPTPDDRLAALRRRMDEVNAGIAVLLQRRARLVLEIGALKRAAGIALHDPERERRMLEDALRGGGTGFPPDALARIFRCIFDESRALIGA